MYVARHSAGNSIRQFTSSSHRCRLIWPNHINRYLSRVRACAVRFLTWYQSRFVILDGVRWLWSLMIEDERSSTDNAMRRSTTNNDGALSSNTEDAKVSYHDQNHQHPSSQELIT